MVKAIAIYQFNSNDDSELSVVKSEIVEVIEKYDGWWKVKNKVGKVGLAPVDYLAAPVTDDAKVVARGKTTKEHKASDANEVSVSKDCQVAILDQSDEYWWYIGICGKTGYIPKDILSLFKKKPEPPKGKEVSKYGFREVAPDKALCDEEVTVLFSFEKPLPDNGQFMVLFKGEHCEKAVDGERINDFTLKAKTPKYYPAERTKVTISYQKVGRPSEVIIKGIHFGFRSKLDFVHKILTNESDPLHFMCSSFQIEHGDVHNLDHILCGIIEKKIPEGIEILKNTKSALVAEDAYPKETPTLLHFAAFYNLKKLAKSLLKCPGAEEALAIKNCHGNGPQGVAKMRKNNELEGILENHKVEDFRDESIDDYYTSMENCYEIYTRMDNAPKSTYVVPKSPKRTPVVEDEDQLYEDMGQGSQEPERFYDTPRLEGEDHFDGYDDEYDDNCNKVELQDRQIQKQMDEYKVFGRMTEKEVQLALLMKRVKERYITQEQALEMARVLRLEPQQTGRAPEIKKKPKVMKRVSAPNVSEVGRKEPPFPRTLSTSSGSSVSSVGSTGSSGYTSDGQFKTKPQVPVPRSAKPFCYSGLQPPSTNRASPSSTSPRKTCRPDPHPPSPACRPPRH